MVRVFNMLFDVAGYFIKIAFLAIIMVVLLQYTSLNIAAYKILNKAEEEGRFTIGTYNEYMSKLTIDTSNVVVANIQPSFNEYADKLGDPLDLEISKTYKFKVFNKELSIPITVKKSGINTGYYGRGY